MSPTLQLSISNIIRVRPKTFKQSCSSHIALQHLLLLFVPKLNVLGDMKGQRWMFSRVFEVELEI